MADIDHIIQPNRRRGRGAVSNVTGRYENLSRECTDDGWDGANELPPFKTHIQQERAKSIISTNNSPDLNFSRSINMYRGCEHGCSYCYARPSHSYMGLSPGLDFETKLFAKTNAVELLERELAKKSYKPEHIALGTNTDPYQPIERQYKLTRGILELLDRVNHPVAILTKSALITRDIDILSNMAKRGLVKAAISVTSLDNITSRKMEPRASAPHKRLEALRQLSDAGIPTTAMVAPVIPALNDFEIESILEALKDTGASNAGYILLRLPLELKQLFREWLEAEFPDRASHVINLLRSMHGGQDYRSDWGLRRAGSGPYAEQIATRFRIKRKRLGFTQDKTELRLDLFKPPTPRGGQYKLI